MYYIVFIWDVLYYLTEEIVQLIDKKVDVKNDQCLYVHTGAGRLLRCCVAVEMRCLFLLLSIQTHNFIINTISCYPWCFEANKWLEKKQQTCVTFRWRYIPHSFIIIAQLTCRFTTMFTAKILTCLERIRRHFNRLSNTRTYIYGFSHLELCFWHSNVGSLRCLLSPIGDGAISEAFLKAGVKRLAMFYPDEQNKHQLQVSSP